MDIFNKKRGLSPADGVYHEEDHIEFSRRRFMKSFGIAGGLGFMLSGLPVRAATMAGWALPPIVEKSDRILIMLRLKGGNDGINTIIPLDQLAAYHLARPQIGYTDNAMIKLDDHLAMSPHLAKLKPLWDEGMMKLILGVGYPEQNYSHFRSSDIWSSASDANDFVQSGWIARYVEETFPEYVTEPPVDPPAIQIGGASSILFNGELIDKVGFETFSANQIEDFANSGNVHSLDDLPDCNYGQQLQYLRTVTNSTYRFVESIKKAYDIGTNNVETYTDTRFGNALKVISRLIKGGLQTKIYVVELDGFDTHSNQLTDHPYLLNEFAENISSFFSDMANTIYEEKLLAVTFSEFGRRIEENNSPGTDHGAANVMMAFGKALNGHGYVGEYPSLTDTDEYGNLIFNVDFRNIYSTLFTEWLCLEDPISDKILKNDFGDPLKLGFDCLAPISTKKVVVKSIVHKPLYGHGDVQIYLNLPMDTFVMVDILDMQGNVYTLERPSQKSGGEYYFPLKGRLKNIPAGNYIYRIRTKSGEYKGQFVMP